jgi:hypothetical protein
MIVCSLLTKKTLNRKYNDDISALVKPAHVATRVGRNCALTNKKLPEFYVALFTVEEPTE